MPVILQFWLWFSGIAGLVLSAVVYNVCETLQVKYRAARDAKVGRPSVEGTDLFVTNPSSPVQRGHRPPRLLTNDPAHMTGPPDGPQP